MKLSKPERRLLDLAKQHAVIRNPNKPHAYDSLILKKLLRPDGRPTTRGWNWRPNEDTPD